MTQSNFHNLAHTLYEGEVRASDIKTMPGKRVDVSRDELAKSLLESMQRMGLVKDGSLVDKNSPN